MTQTLNQPTVELAQGGQVIIRAEELALPGLINLKPFCDKKVPGRMYLNKRSELVFEPYLVGQRMQKVRQKEVVGQVEVARYSDKLKFSLSLPLKMSKELMSLTVLEQATLVAEALRTGLYERMMHVQTLSGERLKVSGESQSPSPSGTPPKTGEEIKEGNGETQPKQAA